MNLSLSTFIAGTVTVLTLGACTSTKHVSPASTSPDNVQRFADEAYVFGYPLVITGITRDVQTATPYVTRTKAPLNQFGHLRSFPNDTFTDVVTPNADTLYSVAWLDLKEQPVVLTLPSSNRYYLAPMLSAWTEVIAAPGTRTSGNNKKEFVIAGPDWTGRTPTGLEVIKSPTNTVVILGRIQTNGQKDYVNVHEIQDGFEITPLSYYGKPYLPPSNVAVNPSVDLKTPPVDQVAGMDARTFYTELAEELKQNPPTVADVSMLPKLRAIGIDPGQSFKYEALSEVQKRALDAGYYAGVKRLQNAVPRGTINQEGWVYGGAMGTYGTDYLARAYVAETGWGANTSDDAVYMRAVTDGSGQPLNGREKYVIRFAKGQTPPVKGFWSLTMYNSKRFFVKNPLNRYAIGDRDRLVYNADGSLDLYIQAQSPGKSKESNWLPAPAGDSFNLVMRMYWPKESILNNTWKMPGIQRVEQMPNKLSKNVQLQ